MNNPNDLISRDAAIAAFDDERVDRNYGDVSPESVIRVIESIPPVDAVPVVHARWKPLQEDVYWGNSLKRMYCDVCNNQAIFDSQRRKFILTCFCPNCGAKMKE